MCRVQRWSHTALRPRRSTPGDNSVSLPPPPPPPPPFVYHEYLPASRTVSFDHPVHPTSSGSAPASVISSADTPNPSARNARTPSSRKSERQTVLSVPRRSESVCALRTTSEPSAALSVSDGRDDVASNVSHASGHKVVKRGVPGTRPEAPGARARSPEAAISARANGRLSRKTRSTSVLSSGNSNP